MESRKLTVELVSSYLEGAGCKYLHTEGTLSRGKMRYIAQCGHESVCNFADFKRGLYRKCRPCMLKDRGKLLITPYEEVAKEVESEGCKLVTTSEEYKNRHQKVVIIGRCGHKITTTMKNFGRGHNRICKTCEGLKHHEYKRLPYEVVSKWFSDNGCRLLSEEYHGCMERLKYIAQCGHENEISLNEFQHGSGRKCRKCTMSNSSQQIVDDCIRDIFGGRFDVVSEYRIRTESGSQRIDIAIPEANVAIEFNGVQHYEDVGFFGRIPFERRRKLDEAKERWCLENGFVLLRIDGRCWSKRNLTRSDFKSDLKAFVLPIVTAMSNGVNLSRRIWDMPKPGETEEHRAKKKLDSNALLYIEDSNGDVEEELVEGFGWV